MCVCVCVCVCVCAVYLADVDEKGLQSAAQSIREQVPEQVSFCKHTHTHTQQKHMGQTDTLMQGNAKRKQAHSVMCYVLCVVYDMCVLNRARKWIQAGTPSYFSELVCVYVCVCVCVCV